MNLPETLSLSDPNLYGANQRPVVILVDCGACPRKGSVAGIETRDRISANTIEVTVEWECPDCGDSDHTTDTVDAQGRSL